MSLFKTQSTTQDHLDIEDIKSDLVILKNGVATMVLETSSVNFDLLSEREQDAKIYAFAGMLNSLSFHVQIIVQTKKTDLGRYVELLEDHKNRQVTPGLRVQMEIYIEFIKNLTVTNQVLDKRFFIAIPNRAAVVVRPSIVKQFFGKKDKIININEIIERAKVQLYPKRDHIVKQLKRMGLFARQLNTNELVKLFYGFYDPERTGLEKLNLSLAELSTPMVEPELSKDKTAKK